jgi:hypothetical protein
VPARAEPSFDRSSTQRAKLRAFRNLSPPVPLRPKPSRWLRYLQLLADLRKRYVRDSVFLSDLLSRLGPHLFVEAFAVVVRQDVWRWRSCVRRIHQGVPPADRKQPRGSQASPAQRPILCMENSRMLMKLAIRHSQGQIGRPRNARRRDRRVGRPSPADGEEARPDRAR